MPLCILTDTTSCNKTFYIGFAFMRHEDIASYRWLIQTVCQVYCQVGQNDGAAIILTDKEDALIKTLSDEMPAGHHLLCKWHISPNTSTSSTQPNPKPLPKKRQRNHPLNSDPPSHLLDKTIQVAEQENQTKARAEDKLLRQKQKDWEKELKELGANKKDLRFLGESLDSHFFPPA